ncbi:MAG: hypothetical protein RLO81_05615 [Fulvivirga sp.]|uniref:hypothetical protein n=1 Tax=Fulvivirga sp. TaxID=1931237 RepID=UPI0032ECD855
MKIQFYIFSIMVFLIGLLIENEIIINIAAIVLCINVCYSNYQRKGAESIDVIFMFLIASGLTALGNTIAILSQGEANESVYFLYMVPEHILKASTIHYVGTLFILVGYNLIPNKNILPKINKFQIKPRYTSGILILGIIIIYIIISGRLPQLGTVSSYIKLFPILIIFFLARYGASIGSTKIKNFAFILLIIESLRALFFEYLRTNIILPLVAYFFGLLIGYKNFKYILSNRFYVIYVAAFFAFSYFTTFGALRSTYVTGVERISLLATEEESRENTFWSRLSNLNQLTNIVDLESSNGYYDGATLNYFAFALIPRFLWPEKPKIAKGRWFAIEIGQAYEKDDGQVNNSINMTVPGEFHLNYGWPGLVVGCILFGILISMIWNTCDFWSADYNIFRSVFGFYLLFLGLFSLGADLQVVITIIAIYLLTLLVSKLFITIA